ncbi:MAG TPA: hypothetical protein VFT72_18260 [Opitutaceae bacterium]|nr:hypothetical protein [Opitutaceae bacterium]
MPLSLNDPEQIIISLRDNLGRFRTHVDATTADDARFSLRALADYTLQLKRHESGTPLMTSILESAMRVNQSGLNLLPSTPEDLAAAESRLSQGWPGLISATLLVPAWRIKNLPPLESIPPWLWGHYSRWILNAPIGAADADAAESFARITETFLSSLATWVERNSGSAAVRDAIGEVMRFHPGGGLIQSASSLKAHEIALGKIIARTCTDRSSHDYFFVPRTDPTQRLRVGFLFAGILPTAQTRAALAHFQNLDPAQFEVILFTPKLTETDFEKECVSAASEVVELKGALSDSIERLREADLDVAVYVPNLAFEVGEWIHLGFYRIARVALLLPSALVTSGLPAIDLRVLGENSRDESTERVAHLSGPGPVFDPGSNARPDDEALSLLRISLGLKDAQAILATVGDATAMSSETLQSWADILSAAPEATLIWSLPAATNRSLAEFLVRTLALNHGIKSSRIVLHYDDRHSALSLASVYLDPMGNSNVEGLSTALAFGVAPVTRSGQTSRSNTSAELLKAAGLGDCVTYSRSEYMERALALLHDAELNRAVATRASEAPSTFPQLTDGLARSDSFGALIRTALKLHAEQGEAAFSAELPPITTTEPAGGLTAQLEKALLCLEAGDAEQAFKLTSEVLAFRPGMSVARHIHGRALVAKGQHGRAIGYFLGALQGNEHSADLWWEIAQAFRATSANPQAIDALSACLQLDGTRLEAWELLAELATEAGHAELIEETHNVLQSLRGEALTSKAS